MSTTAASNPTRTVEGVTLTQVPLGYLTPNGDFLIEADEHDGGWYVHRVDRAPADYGVSVNGEPSLTDGFLSFRLNRAVMTLIELGHIR